MLSFVTREVTGKKQRLFDRLCDQGESDISDADKSNLATQDIIYLLKCCKMA